MISTYPYAPSGCAHSAVTDKGCCRLIPLVEGDRTTELRTLVWLTTDPSHDTLPESLRSLGLYDVILLALGKLNPGKGSLKC